MAKPGKTNHTLHTVAKTLEREYNVPFLSVIGLNLGVHYVYIIKTSKT